MKPSQTPLNPQDLRHIINTYIDKLSDRSTFQQASTSLSHVASSLPSDSLPTFLSCILTLDSSLKSLALSHCTLLLSLLATCHPPSSLSPHLPKIITSLLPRLRHSDSSLRSACVTSVTSLAPLDFKLTLHSFLQCISTEQDTNSQLGGCLCLKAAIDAVDKISDGGGEGVEGEMRKRVMPKVMKLLRGDGFKAKGALLGVLGSVVGFRGGVVINGGGGNVVVECAVEMLSCDDWVARKAAAEVLLVVVGVVDVEVALHYKQFVVTSLDSRRFDKVKVTRETMNRAWEAWKEVHGGPPDEDLPLSRCNSTISTDYGNGRRSPPLPRRSSFAGSETPKPKKTITKTRSSLSDGSVAFTSLPSGQHRVCREMLQGKKSLSNSRSSLSDDSTITDSSSVSRSSHDFGFETPDSRKHTSKSRSYLPDDFATSKRSPSKVYDKKLSPSQNAESRRSLDWNIETAIPAASSTKLSSEDCMQLVNDTEEVTTSSPEKRSNFFKSSDERSQKSVYRYRTRVNPLIEEDEAHRFPVRRGTYEEVGENAADPEELSLIRNQLLQIERQQSNLLDLVQKFMGKSQNGIHSLEARVSGLERALDEISYDLAVQSGRVANNSSAGNTCCPSTEFLSPKFWKRTDGRSSISRSSCSGSLSNRDTNAEALKMDSQRNDQNEDKCRDSWLSAEFSNNKCLKSVGQNNQRGRTCSPRSFDAPSAATCITPVVRGV